MTSPRSSAGARPTGLPPGVHVGQTGPRLLAALVEVGPVALLLGLVLLFGLVLEGRGVLAVVSLVLAIGWSLVVWARRATAAAGPGMKLDSLQIVGYHDGRPLGWRRVLLRAAVFAGLSATGVGLLAMLVVMGRHPRRQGWHDLAADAVVIKERPLAPPRPKPAVSGATRNPSRSAVRVGGPGDLGPGATTGASAGPGPAPTTVEPAGLVGAPPAASGGTAATATSPASPSTTPVAAPGHPATPDPHAPDAEGTAVQGDHDWWLHLDDGRDVGIDGLVLLGRNPQPRVGEEDAMLVKVADETRTVSKSHLAVGVDARGIYVMDRGSTNGTTVTGPDGTLRPCPPGDLVDVPAGSIVSFGDHWLEIRPARI